MALLSNSGRPRGSKAMSISDRDLTAHLMRRAGFGATPSELDALTREKTYEEIVDDLVNPERFPAVDQSFVLGRSVSTEAVAPGH